ncbi:hypothetical protein P4C99_20685 [Pontiellaceae bacterium B1224]|nr:hypothetical protein [Pontiellaceae bacterium B1224]
MNKATSIKIAVPAIVILTALWIAWPSILVGSLYFVEKKEEGASQKACGRIVAQGERCIPVILKSIENNGVYRRVHCYLPTALREIGGSAHDDLINRTDIQSDDKKRDRLIMSLNWAFGDESRNHLIVDRERDRLKPPKKKSEPPLCASPRI